MARILKRMTLSLETHVISNEFMSWLIGYMHSHDLEKVYIKHTDKHVYFCF